MLNQNREYFNPLVSGPGRFELWMKKTRGRKSRWTVSLKWLFGATVVALCDKKRRPIINHDVGLLIPQISSFAVISSVFPSFWPPKAALICLVPNKTLQSPGSPRLSFIRRSIYKEKIAVARWKMENQICFLMPERWRRRMGQFFSFWRGFLHGKKFEVNLHLDVFTAAAAADLKDNYFYTSPICPGMNPTCCCLFKMLPY